MHSVSKDNSSRLVKPFTPYDEKFAACDENSEKLVETQPSPTEETYRQLQASYEYFNQALFAGQLPNCLITLQRRRGAYGYFSGGRFENGASQEKRTDEIALNPSLISNQSLVEACATLVHEQCHLWQFHNSAHPTRRGVMRAYHDTEWAAKMEEVGLIPSNTGRPGGKRTGRRMSDYPAPDGRFLAATDALLARGFVIPWTERSVQTANTHNGSTQITIDGKQPKGKRDPSKCKFTCPSCGQNAWAKQTARLACAAIDCNGQMMQLA